MFLHYGISVWLLSSQELKHHTECASQEIHHGQQSFQSVLDTFKVLATPFKWPLVFNHFATADFFSWWNRVCTCPGLILWCALGAKALRLSRAGEGTQQERHWVCPSWATAPSPPSIQRGHRGCPGCTGGQEREARGNAASPQPKIEGRVLPAFGSGTGGAFPHLLPLMLGPTSVEGNRLQNHRGNKSAMRTARLLKMPEGSSFGQEATPGVMGARAGLLQTMPRLYGAVSWRFQQPGLNPIKRIHISIPALERSAFRGLLTPANL